MQSCRLPALLLPHADPAGAKPRRDHRFLDRVSRHEVPKTPGNDDAFKVYDPARVSHIPVSQSVRHPSGVAGSLATPDPRVVGATPLDPGLKAGTPVGVHRSPLFTVSGVTPVTLKCVSPAIKHLCLTLLLFFRYFLVTIVIINHEINNEDLTSVYV